MNQKNSEILHWLWSTRMQINRFTESFNENIALSKKLTFRKNGKLSDLEKGIYSKSSAEAHFLVIAANNFAKAIKKLGNVSNRDQEIIENIEILRNNLEHWDEIRPQFENKDKEKKRAAKKYADKFPDRTPWSFSLDSRGLVIGGILIINDLITKLNILERQILSNDK